MVETTAASRRHVREVLQDDVPALARAMALAFFDDPVVGHCFRDEAHRMRRIRRGFELFLRRVYLPGGACHVAAGLVGGALWLPPGTWKLGRLDQLRLLPAMARIYGSELPRVLQVLGFLEERHPHDPHYYLAFLGVQPDAQGCGIGSALLAWAIERCERDALPAYLEASSERNRALYERNGFDVVEEVELPEAGPPMWLMWREARR